MKMQRSLTVAMCFSMLAACTYDSSAPEIGPSSIIGSWRSETIFLNGVNSEEYIDFLNDGTVFVIRQDNTFNRNYVLGRWHLLGNHIRLERGAEYGLEDWFYKIIESSEDTLILELDISLGRYCCSSEFFPDDQVLKIREVYKRNPD